MLYIGMPLKQAQPNDTDHRTHAVYSWCANMVLWAIGKLDSRVSKLSVDENANCKFNLFAANFDRGGQLEYCR